MLNLLPVKVILGSRSLGTGQRACVGPFCLPLAQEPCGPFQLNLEGQGLRRVRFPASFVLVGEWLEPPQPSGELGEWPQPLLGTGRELGGRCEVLRGRRAAGAGHSRLTLVSLAKPLLISRSSDTWLGLAPLHPHPSAKSVPESFLTAGSGRTVPSAPLTQGDGGWAMSTSCSIPTAPSPGLWGSQVPLARCSSSGASSCPGTALPWVTRLAGGVVCLQGRLQGCLLQCAALCIPQPSALGSFSSLAPALALSIAQLWYRWCPWLWLPCTHPDP